MLYEFIAVYYNIKAKNCLCTISTINNIYIFVIILYRAEAAPILYDYTKEESSILLESMRANKYIIRRFNVIK